MKCFYASGSKRSAAWVLKWMPQLHKYKKGHLHKVYSGLWELQLSFCRHEVSNLGFLMFNDLPTEETESKQCTCKNMTWYFVFHGSFNDWYRVKLIRLDPVWPPRVAEMPDTTASFRSMHLCNAAPSVLFPIYSHKIYQKHLNIVALKTSPVELSRCVPQGGTLRLTASPSWAKETTPASCLNCRPLRSVAHECQCDGCEQIHVLFILIYIIYIYIYRANI